MVLSIHREEEKYSIYMGTYSADKLQLSEGVKLYFYMNSRKREAYLSKSQFYDAVEVYYEVECIKLVTDKFLKFKISNSELANELIRFFSIETDIASKVIFQINELSDSIYRITYLSTVEIFNCK